MSARIVGWVCSAPHVFPARKIFSQNRPAVCVCGREQDVAHRIRTSGPALGTHSSGRRALQLTHPAALDPSVERLIRIGVDVGGKTKRRVVYRAKGELAVVDVECGEFGFVLVVEFCMFGAFSG